MYVLYPLKSESYKLGFKGLLMELQKTGEMSKDSKFLTRTTLKNLERFTITKLEAQLKYDLMDDIVKSKMIFYIS